MHSDEYLHITDDHYINGKARQKRQSTEMAEHYRNSRASRAIVIVVAEQKGKEMAEADDYQI